MSREHEYERYEQARRYGFVVDGALPWNGYRAKPGSHDDGPHHGPFLGGFGTGAFSRDLYGGFSRWHLQPGLHLAEDVPQARLLLRWESASTGGGSRGARYLLTGTARGWQDYEPPVPGFPEESRSYAVLFPDCFEYYDDPQVPVRVLLHYWSPLVFGDEEAAAQPLVFFSAHLENRTAEPLDVSVSLFWPNLLGWRLSRVPSVDRGDRSWPGQTHSGNTARAAEVALPGSRSGSATGIVQERRPEQNVATDMEGEVGLLVEAPRGGRVSRELCMKADLNAVGLPPREQRHTQAWAEEYFIERGELPGTEKAWSAHWHEPLSSAVAASLTLPPESGETLRFSLAWDMPLVVFGSERAWEKRYTREFDASGRNVEAVIGQGSARREEWSHSVGASRATLLGTLTASHIPASGLAESGASTAPGASTAGLPDRISGAVLNELFLLVGNGTAWVARARSTGTGVDEPRLGGGEHFAFLEGFDTGYYYYNTLDLWVYAFPALSAMWPGIAEGIFADYLRSLRTPIRTSRIVYRVGEDRPILVENKAPHDVGSPMGDPWHELNGYTMRDDPNAWKDHNPALVLAFYCHTQHTGGRIEQSDWELLDAAGRHILSQADAADGLPRHGEFGDSTWDALALRGVSAYSGGLVLAAYRVLSEVASRFGAAERGREYAERAEVATRSFEELLWNGRFYRTDSEGHYREAVMSDALLGPYYASLAGLGESLPVRRVRSHLRTAFDYNLTRYADAAHGPLLLSDGRTARFTPDGGEELQINEVIVGSAWALCGMLDWYGLTEEAGELAATLRDVLYGRSGLQFRTPAAWDAAGFFRAPMNMRPLSIWFLAANRARLDTANMAR